MRSFALLSLHRLSLTAFAGLVLFACAAETTALPSGSPDGGVAEGEEGEESAPADSPDESSDAGNAGTGSKKDAGKADAKADGSNCTSKRWYKDGDGDGFGLASSFVADCTQPSGYVADATDCDDTKSTIRPNAVEVCDAVDSNCDTKVNGTPAEAAACTAAAGSYGGTFSIVTTEKVGSTVVNQVTCTGTTSLSIDLARNVVVQGTTTCAYPGSLSAFSKNQASAIEGAVGLDGTFDGKITHTFGSGMTPTFTIKGIAKNGAIQVTSTGSWKPNPMSAVPWETTITINATKD